MAQLTSYCRSRLSVIDAITVGHRNINTAMLIHTRYFVSITSWKTAAQKAALCVCGSCVIDILKVGKL